MVANSEKVGKKTPGTWQPVLASSLFFKERTYSEPPVLLLVLSLTKLAILPSIKP
jgi:hypothetical protein